MKTLRAAWLPAVVLLSAGCLGGPVPRVYVLSEARTAEPATVGAAGLPDLQVETAALPAFLDNTEILVRHGPYTLVPSSTGHWGERLSLGVTHALAADLARRLTGYRVGVERSATPASRRLQLEVDSFDLYPDGRCVLAASWAVVQKSGLAPPSSGRGVFATPAPAAGPAGDEASVKAMAGAVAALADAIVGSL